MAVLNNKSKESNLKIKALIKLKLKAQAATSGQPVGPLLGQYGIPLLPFCNEFNERTSIYNKDVEVFVILKLFIDGSYTFKVKMPSLSFLLLRASKRVENSDKNNSFIEIEVIEVPSITVYQLFEVVIYKINNTEVSSNNFNKIKINEKELIMRGLGTLRSINNISLISK